ncbi:MAG: HipA N-terminal domain-containing protein [Clostridiales bacterium]|nr:HipA N-terminal domain-containing protein [Clostridiales bacterium]MDD7319390.1 HipA N-terminal domain-containing protein [Prevotellaceae bacterium]
MKETDAGYSFKYDTAYIQKENASAVSLTLPLRVEAYNSKCWPWKISVSLIKDLPRTSTRAHTSVVQRSLSSIHRG